MKTSTLGILAISVLFAAMLVSPLTDAFAVSNKKSVSSEEKKMEEQKSKIDEKKDTTSKTKEKNMSKTMKSTKHRKMTLKKERLAAGVKHG